MNLKVRIISENILMLTLREIPWASDDNKVLKDQKQIRIREGVELPKEVNVSITDYIKQVEF